MNEPMDFGTAVEFGKLSLPEQHQPWCGCMDLSLPCAAVFRKAIRLHPVMERYTRQKMTGSTPLMPTPTG